MQSSVLFVFVLFIIIIIIIIIIILDVKPLHFLFRGILSGDN